MKQKIFKVIKALFIAALLLSLFSLGLSLASIYSIPRDKAPEKAGATGLLEARIIIESCHLLGYQGQFDSLSGPFDVLIENGIIMAIDSAGTFQHRKGRHIDAKDKVLAPSLIDMHTHLFDPNDLKLYLSMGVGRVRNMMGFPMHLRWKKWVLKREMVGSLIHTASPTLNSGEQTVPLHKNLKDLEEIPILIAQYKQDGYDFIKVYDGLSELQLKTIHAACRDLDFGFAGHPPHAMDIDALLELPFISLEHIEEIVQGPMHYELDSALGRKIARKIKAKGIPVCVTLSPFHNIYRSTIEGDSFINSIPKHYLNKFSGWIGERQLRKWIGANEGTYTWNVNKYRTMEQLVLIFEKEGVELLLGTDTGPSLTIPGISLHQEIQLLHKLGLKPSAIIKSGTQAAAQCLGIANQVGEIDLQYRADLVLLSASPLEDLSVLKKPEYLMTNGLLFDNQMLTSLKEEALQRSSWIEILGRFSEHLWSL